MDITTSTVFIPGATSGIGLALAQRFQRAGSTVIIGGRRTDLLDRLAAEHGFDAVRIDTADPASILAARDDVLARHPDLDAVVAMAGIMVAEDVHSPDFLETAERTVTTNLLGPLRLLAAFTEHLQSRPAATFMTVSSGLAHVPFGPFPTYNATKAAIHGLSETIRLQLADTSVQVVELVPPAVQTELTPGQSTREGYLPLDDFADEAFEILRTQPDVHEVLVERAKFLRYAEVRGDYDQVTATLNSR